MKKLKMSFDAQLLFNIYIPLTNL